MATVDRYKIVIDTQGKEKIIDINDELDKLGTKVSNAAKIGVAAFGALAISAARMADQMVDLAGVAGISTAKLYQMSTAAEAAGGSFDDMGGILLRFSNSVQGAVEGNDKLRDSFAKIGISRDELATLNDEQLFQAVVQGLGAMEDGAQKTALAVDLLGKKAATMNLRQFAELTSGAADPNVERLFNNAADAIGRLETAFRSLQLAALTAIEPILTALGEFEFTVADAQKAIQILGTVIAGIFAATTINLIFNTVKAIQAFGLELRTAGASAAFLSALTGPRGIAVVAGAAIAATAAYKTLGAAIDDASTAQEEFNAEGGRVYRGQVDRTGTPPTVDTGRPVELTQREQTALAAARTTEQIKKQNELTISLRRTMLDVSDIESNRARQIIANNQALNEFLLVEQQLKEQIAEEEAKGEQTNQVVIAQLNTRIGLAKQFLTDTQALNDAEYERLNTIRLLNQARQDELNLIERAFSGANETSRINSMMAEATGKTSRERLRALDEEIEKNRFSQEILRINADIQASNDLDEIRALRELIQVEETRHATNMNNIDAEQIAIDALNNSRIAGVVSAMEQLQQQFTPYQMAQDAVLSAWNNIGSAIDRIAQGGKASFKDMARSIIADLGAMIAKAYLFEAIKTGMTALGIPLPGLATGGPAKAGQPYIVGEKGPELFVPKSAGTVIPNNKVNSAAIKQTPAAAPSTTVNNVYNISAVDAKSVAQLFYENRKTMLGTMNIAQKELPYGVG